ncbi:hypothetical protein GH714_019113 [Hevea brasiliensis]|uniref:Pentacotripeptide-repeat region of PRORP domain-containing protein n=1 Tax=Hevea brasiliensis TaxID=3981 RepID=A0A6A6MDN2_HEVBR|nr:hypothetical protein GH714_019113 [Hevea brasiliensis]
MHALVIVSGYQSSLAVNNSLIDMYGKCLNAFSAGEVFQELDDTNEVTWCSLLFAYTNSGQFNAAREVFNLMPTKVDIAWNTMIAGLSRYGEIEFCLDLFKKMRQSLCEPDQWTYSALVSACTESSEFLCGCMLHSVIIKNGWSSAVEAKNSILSFYAKLGSLNDAMKVFEPTGILTQVSWNAIIDAHMKAGNIHEAFLMFQCLLEKNIVSWTSMITGYAKNGYGEEALSFFAGMSLGLIEDGRVLFESMRSVHGLSYEADHVACMVDMLGRGGYLAEAKELTNKYSKTGYVRPIHVRLCWEHVLHIVK